MGNEIIIDEISMISYETFRQIDLRLRQIKENESLFGGVNIILMGDLLQLKPVHGNWIYEQPERFSLETHLWRQFKFFELNINQRQIADPIYGGLVGRFRTGEQTTEDIEILNKRLIKNNPWYNHQVVNWSLMDSKSFLEHKKLTKTKICKALEEIRFIYQIQLALKKRQFHYLIPCLPNNT